MGDLATLLGGIGSLLAGITGSVALGVGFFRTSKRERSGAAESAAERAIDELLDKLGDGEITAEEVAEIRDHLHPKHGKDDQ